MNNNHENHHHHVFRRRIVRMPLFEKETTIAALKNAFIMLRPDIQWKNPVMFVVEIGAFLTLLFIIQMSWNREPTLLPITYFIALFVWLTLTVLFANFATSLAEARGKAQTESLKKTRHKTMAYRLHEDGSIEEVSSDDLKAGDKVVVKAGQTIPGDGEIIEGVAYLDESSITGESSPVIREFGGDRSSVTGGTLVLSDRIVVKITCEKGKSFLDRMIALVEGAVRQRTPNEIALVIVLSAFTLVFLIVVVPLWSFAYNVELYMAKYFNMQTPLKELGTDIPSLIALLVCLAPTTIGALLAAIGIAGMDRALQANIIAISGKAVELAGDVNVVLLDKTGTITLGNRNATTFFPIGKYTESELGRLAAMASFADNTPEGKSILKLYESHKKSKLRMPPGSTFIPFTATTRMSGVNLSDGKRIRKGATDSVVKFVTENHGNVPHELGDLVLSIASKGATPFVVSVDNEIAGVVSLEDTLKPHIHERLESLRKMGLRIIMVTGDNPFTAAAIAKLAGIEEYLAQTTPEDKAAYIKSEQAKGNLVAMMGDGTNDAPALAQADVALAMNAGTEAAKEAANMVDLDSDPTKLVKVVEIGKKLLITRGALTTFSVANDIAKFFAIIPALFASTLPWLRQMDIMNLHSPTSAILSAVIFNALIIPMLIPIAIKGVRCRLLGAEALFRRNLTIWGFGGVIAPFIGIKLIDLILVFFNLIT